MLFFPNVKSCKHNHYGCCVHWQEDATTSALAPTPTSTHAHLRIVYASPRVYCARLVGLDQLEAAFEIADTNGDGLLEGEEIGEALQVRVRVQHLYMYACVTTVILPMDRLAVAQLGCCSADCMFTVGGDALVITLSATAIDFVVST
jgi:hypothetical protein